MAKVIAPQGRDKRAEDAQMLSMLGSIAGGSMGGPAGAAVGGAAGQEAAGKPTQPAQPVQSEASQQQNNAVSRRIEQAQAQQHAADLQKAQDALQYLPPEQQTQFAPTISQAMNVAQNRGAAGGYRQWQE